MLIIEHAVNDIIMALIMWQALASRAKKMMLSYPRRIARYIPGP